MSILKFIEQIFNKAIIKSTRGPMLHLTPTGEQDNTGNEHYTITTLTAVFLSPAPTKDFCELMNRSSYEQHAAVLERPFYSQIFPGVMK